MTNLTETTFRLTGVTPLLMHNVQMANPLNTWARQVRELTARKKTMTEEEFAEQKAFLQFQGGLYWDDEIGLCMPSYNIFKSIVEGGRMSKDGTRIEQAVLTDDQFCAVDPWTDKFNDAKEIYDAGHFLTTMVKIGQSTVPSTRPQFNPWSIDIALSVDETIIDIDSLLSCAEAAGKYKGLGDGRLKGFGKGRYNVEQVK